MSESIIFIRGKLATVSAEAAAEIMRLRANVRRLRAKVRRYQEAMQSPAGKTPLKSL